MSSIPIKENVYIVEKDIIIQPTDREFTINFNLPYKKGDLITYDYNDGYYLEVKDVRIGHNCFEHDVIFLTKHKDTVFPAEKLKMLTQYYKIGSTCGEYSTTCCSEIVNNE